MCNLLLVQGLFPDNRLTTRAMYDPVGSCSALCWSVSGITGVDGWEFGAASVLHVLGSFRPRPCYRWISIFMFPCLYIARTRCRRPFSAPQTDLCIKWVICRMGSGMGLDYHTRSPAPQRTKIVPPNVTYDSNYVVPQPS